MKALVYANYSKFITASSTIHDLRGKVEGMEDEMKKLSESVEKITGVSDKISGNLQSKREIIDHLSGVHHLLQKLQFLVDLPSRLRHSISSKNYEEAVTYWRKTRHVLEKYKHLPSFTPIESQCSDIVKELTTMLTTAYFGNNVSFEILSSYSELLLDLDQPHDKLCSRFASGRLEQLIAMMNEFQTTPMVAIQPPPTAPPSTKSDPTTPIVSPEAEAAYASVSAMNRKIMEPVTEFITIFCARFVSRRGVSTQEQFASIVLLDKSMDSIFKSYSAIINKYLLKVTSSSTSAQSSSFSASDSFSSSPPSPTPSSEVLRAASDCLDPLLGTYWSTVLLPTTAPTTLLEIKKRTKLGDTSFYINNLISSLLDVSFQDIQAEIVKVISSGLEKVTQSISDYVAASSSSASASTTPTLASTLLTSPTTTATAPSSTTTTPASAKTTKDAIDSITTGIVASLDASFASKLTLLFSLCSPGSFLESSAANLLASVQTKIQTLLQKIVEQFGGTEAARVTTTTNTSSSSSSPHRLLVAPLVFDALKSKALPLLSSTLGRIISQTKHTELGTDAAQNRIIEFGSELSSASQRLIQKHVRDTGMRIGEMLRKSIETPNWLKRPEPHGVDGAIEIVVSELTLLQQPVGVLYEQGPRKERKRVLLGSIYGADNKVAVTSDVEFDQLFQKKVNYFDKVEFNGRAIATATIKIALKTYLESVRLQTYSTNGYQQLQVDVHYLNLVLDQYVSDPASLDAMMMDILNSVKERCIQPYSMDLPIIAKLCSEAFAELNGTTLPTSTASTSTTAPPTSTTPATTTASSSS